jgi:hypothetical protein
MANLDQDIGCAAPNRRIPLSSSSFLEENMLKPTRCYDLGQ